MKRNAAAAAAMLLVAAGCGNTPAPKVSLPPVAPSGRTAPAIVQVEDDRLSRPQYGIQKADLIFEYLTEGEITRFSVLYWTPPSGVRIEPVRSARLVTLKIRDQYGGVLFYSGASNHVQAIIDSQHTPAFNENSEGGHYFQRDSSRQAPYNLMTTGDLLKEGVDKSQARVTYPQPKYGEPAASGGTAATAFSFQMTPSHHVAYTYDAASKTYRYKDDIGDLIDVNEASKPVQIVNVVLIRVAHHDAGYTEDVLGENGIDFDLTGSGPAEIYTRGQHWTGKWDLGSGGPISLSGPDGKAFPLPQGLTFFELVDPDLAVQGS